MKQVVETVSGTMASFVRIRASLVNYFLKKVGLLYRFNLLGLLLICLITGCQRPTSNSSSISASNLPSKGDCQVIEHDFGETNICDTPKKIAVLGPYVLDSVLTLGVQPSGYAEIYQFQRGDFNNPSEQIPYLGDRVTTYPVNLGRSAQPSLEAIAKLKPDLIIGGVVGNKDEYRLLSKIAPTILVNDSPTDDWRDSILILAKALKREQEAQDAINRYQQQIEATKIQLAPVVSEVPKVLVISGDLKQFITLANEHSFSGRLLTDLGFEVVAPKELKDTKRLSKISLEILPNLDADQIIIQGINLNAKDFFIQKLGLPIENLQEKLTDFQLTKVKQEWKQNAITKRMKANQEGRVYFTTYYLWKGLRGPIGTQLILNDLRQMLL